MEYAKIIVKGDYNNFDNFQIKLREAEKIYIKVV